MGYSRISNRSTIIYAVGGIFGPSAALPFNPSYFVRLSFTRSRFTLLDMLEQNAVIVQNNYSVDFAIINVYRSNSYIWPTSIAT
jgi:hypothetical protein